LHSPAEETPVSLTAAPRPSRIKKRREEETLFAPEVRLKPDTTLLRLKPDTTLLRLKPDTTLGRLKSG